MARHFILRKCFPIFHFKIFLFFLFGLLSFFSFTDQASAFSDNFDSYPTGTLTGNGGWVGAYSGNVTDVLSFSSANSVVSTGGQSNSHSITEKYTRWMEYFSSPSARQMISFDDVSLNQKCYITDNGIILRLSTPVFGQSITLGNSSVFAGSWHSYEMDIDNVNYRCRLRIDEGDWTSFVNWENGITLTYFSLNSGGGNQYFDNVSSGNTPFTPPSVIVIDYPPQNAIIQTNTPFELTITNNDGYSELWRQTTNETQGFQENSVGFYNFNASSTSFVLPNVFVPLGYGTSTVSFWLAGAGGNPTSASSSVTVLVSAGAPIPAPSDTFSYEACDFSDYSFGIGYLLNGLCEIAVWLVAPSPAIIQNYSSLTFEDKFPFSYFYDLKDIYTNTTATTTESMPELVLNAGVLGNVTVFSASSTIALMGNTAYGTFRSLFIYGFWLFFGVYVFERIRHLL